MYESNYEELKKVYEEGSVRWIRERQPRPAAPAGGPQGGRPAGGPPAGGRPDMSPNFNLWNNAVKRFQSFQLWEDGAPGFDDRAPLQIQPNLIFIPAPNQTEKRGTIIIAHGGNFVLRCGHEGFHPALKFADMGFNTAILTYRLVPYTRFDAIADMQRAIRLLRSKQDELGINDKIAVMGFSAGGMLSGNCATHFDYGNPDAKDPIERFSCRPDAAVLCYGAFATVAFAAEMLKANPFNVTREKAAERLYLAPENNVTADTPPFYIWQTISDDPRNAFVLGSKLTEAGVPFELHCYETSHHGVGLCDGHDDSGSFDEHLSKWPEPCARWLKIHGL